MCRDFVAMINVSILCTDPRHPMTATLEDLPFPSSASLTIVHDKRNLAGGDLLLLIACHEYIEQKYIEKFRASAVIHCSDVPDGKGWSPHVWEILEGSTELTMTLMDVQEQFDSGNVWKKLSFEIQRNEIFKEINEKICRAQHELIKFAIENFLWIETKAQRTAKPEDRIWPKRTPADSQLDPSKSIEEQFDLLRVADPLRYPCFFYLRGRRFVLELKGGEKNDWL